MSAIGTVLIVEKDTPHLNKLAGVLGFDGYTIARAIDAEEAARFLRHAHPDVVLLATKLPGMGGLELAKLLKSNRDARRITVIAMLDRDDPVDAAQAGEAGCDGSVRRPLDFNTLSREIELCRARVANPARPRVGDAPSMRSFLPDR